MKVKGKSSKIIIYSYNNLLRDIQDKNVNCDIRNMKLEGNKNVEL